MVKVTKCRFVAPQEECYQDGCALIKYGPCFATPLHLNDSYFDTLQFLFKKKYLSQVFSVFALL